MLRTLGIRAKLLAILAAPLIVLVVLSGIVVNGAMRTASRAEQVSSLTGMSSSVMSFIGQLQRERSLTDAVQHASDEARGALKAQLVKQRVATGLSLNDTRDQLEQASTKGFGAAFAKAVLAAQNGHGAIQSARRSADTGDQPFEFVMASYDTAVDRDLALVRAVSDLTDDPGVAASLRSYVSLAEGVDEAWHERDVASDAFAAGSISPSDYSRYAGAVRQEETTFQAFQSTATAAARAAFAKAVPQDLQYQLVAGRQHVEELLFGATAGAQGFDWDKVADARIAALTGLLPRLGADVGVQADDVAASARQRALTLAAVTGAGVLLLLGLAYLMARRLVRRLTRLTQLATLTAERLPSLVEQVQTPGEKPHLDLGRVPVDSRDEVGRLAEAFNAVNEVTMRVAEEQAALRGSIADIFVNVARRNQVLLSRQLALIDAMESRETNADTLENLFRVDHLSTRMRRNAESLLVLAGIDASRRLREPLALTDVVRSAVSEIESYDRVDLAAGFDAPVLGRAAMTAAHLLAELLENATTFSSPGSRVVVATSPAKSGVEVTITDEGLGMSDEDLARANDVMANPPVLELALAQRLGFYVVGRLAARLGARVTLRKGRRSGTVAKVWLPADLFTTGSLPHVADPLLDRLAEGPVAEEAVLALPDTPVVPNDAAALLADGTLAADMVGADAVGADTVAAGTVAADAPVEAAPVEAAPVEAAPVVAAQPGPADASEVDVPVQHRSDDVPPAEVVEERPRSPFVTGAAAIDVVPGKHRRGGGSLFSRFANRQPDPRVETKRDTAVPVSTVPPLPTAIPSEALADRGVATVPVMATDAAPLPSRPTFGAAAEFSQLNQLPPRQPVSPAASPEQREATTPAPAPAAPFGTAPAPAAPFGTAPAPAAPFGTAPAPAAPFGTAPVGAPAAPVFPDVAPAQFGTPATTPAAPVPSRAPLGEALPMPGTTAGAPEALGAKPLPTRVPGTSRHAQPGATSTDSLGAPAPVDEPEPPAATPVLPTRADLHAERDRVAARSHLASQALSELSRLNASGYTPAAVTAGAGLTRRQPKADAAPAPEVPAAPRRPRDAEAVRARLSGFRAGVERAHSAAGEPSASPTDATSPVSPTHLPSDADVATTQEDSFR